MARAFVEFIHSQQVPWAGAKVATHGAFSAARARLQSKVLTRDDASGETSSLVSYARGFEWSEAACDGFDEEVFVLNGSIEGSFGSLRRHGYAYWTAGYPRTARAREDSVVLTFLNRDPNRVAARHRDEGLVQAHDPISQPWDQSNMDPRISHLLPWRKNLRLSPDGTMRSYLLAGLPHGIPIAELMGVERHPVVEEMFMVFGDIHCPLGIMRAGSYFWRPPHEWHGPHYSLSGFLVFMRTPGSNTLTTEWSEPRERVTLDPAHRPSLPVEYEAIGREPRPDPVEY